MQCYLDKCSGKFKVSTTLLSNTKCRVKKKQIIPLTPRVKTWVIQSFLTFGSVDQTLKYDHLLERC